MAYYILNYIFLIGVLFTQTFLTNSFRTNNDGEIFRVVVNHPATLTCDFNRANLDQVWMRWWFTESSSIVYDNIDASTDGYKMWSSGTKGFLRINNATERFEGVYRCYIIHSTFDVTGEVCLELLYPPKGILINGLSPLGSYIPVVLGVPTQLTCSVRGSKPPPTIQFKSDHSITFGTNNTKCTLNNTCTLKANITTLVIDDGVVHCIVEHPALGSPINNSITINVIVPIKKTIMLLTTSYVQELVTIDDKTITVFENSRLFLQCSADATRPSVDMWFTLNNEDISNATNMIVTELGAHDLLFTKSKITIISSKHYDNGALCCLARQEYSTRNADHVSKEKICKTLYVKDYVALTTLWLLPDSTITTEQGLNATNRFVLKDESVTFKCSCNATNPKTSLKYFLNNEELNNGTESVLQEDDGLYKTTMIITLVTHDFHQTTNELCCVGKQKRGTEANTCVIINIVDSFVTLVAGPYVKYEDVETQKSWFEDDEKLTILITSPIIVIFLIILIYMVVRKKRGNKRKPKTTRNFRETKQASYMEYRPNENNYTELDRRISDSEHIYQYIK